MLKTATEQGNPYKLAILDWHMPEMDGLEVARHIRNDKTIAPVQILMLSSVAVNKHELVDINANVNQFLTKPIHQHELYNCLVKLTRNTSQSLVQETPDVTELNSVERTFSANILLVEDNMINQDVARFMLEQAGCGVDLAMNGKEALEMVDNKHYDLVLMDCHMPEMDGFEATRLIRGKEIHNHTQTPIVALTANVLDGIRERCLGAGMNDLLTKPFNRGQLHAILHTWTPDTLQQSN